MYAIRVQLCVVGRLYQAISLLDAIFIYLFVFCYCCQRLILPGVAFIDQLMYCIHFSLIAEFTH